VGTCTKSKLESKKEDYTDTNFILIVADDGVGIPESFNLDNSDTLGIAGGISCGPVGGQT
jgi:two-component sensor histidine kinase